MSKSMLHKKTGTVCLVCDESIETAICLHKTRRQSHNLCLDCALGYIKPILDTITDNLRLNIKNDALFIKCPGSYHSLTRNRCSCKINIRKLKFPDSCAINTDIFRILLVLNNDKAFICPEKKCGGVVVIDYVYGIDMLQCPHCSMQWCRKCLVSPFHEGKNCMQHMAETTDTENGQYLLKMNRDGLLKYCPRCQGPVIRDGGCNKIICAKCKAKWCWLCREVDIDYDHFNYNNTNPCANKLWEGVDK